MASPNTTPSKRTEPLLGTKATDITAPKKLSSVTSTVIKTLSILRIILGAACVIAPQTSCELFFYPVPAAFSVLPRLFGIRDLALGVLLITAEDKHTPSGGRRELGRMLWANIAADSVDTMSIMLSLAQGNIGRLPAAAFGVGAGIFLIMEGVAMCYDPVCAHYATKSHTTHSHQA